jgi:hypothetical protein
LPASYAEGLINVASKLDELVSALIVEGSTYERCDELRKMSAGLASVSAYTDVTTEVQALVAEVQDMELRLVVYERLIAEGKKTEVRVRELEAEATKFRDLYHAEIATSTRYADRVRELEAHLKRVVNEKTVALIRQGSAEMRRDEIDSATRDENARLTARVEELTGDVNAYKTLYEQYVSMLDGARALRDAERRAEELISAAGEKRIAELEAELRARSAER